MTKLIHSSIMVKLAALLLIASLIPTAIVGYLLFRSSRSVLSDEVRAGLTERARQERSAILKYLHRAVLDVRSLAGNPAVAELFKTRQSAGHSEGDASQTREAINPEDRVNKVLTGWMELYGPENSYEDIILISREGRVLRTLKQLADLNVAVTTEPLSTSGLETAYKRALETRKAAIVDFGTYPVTNTRAAFAAAPVFDDKNEWVGVVALRLGTGTLDGILETARQGGKTVDSYLVGNDLMLRSSSRVLDEARQKGRIETRATKQGLKGEAGSGQIDDARGTPVLSSWQAAGIPRDPALNANFDWVLVNQVNASEALGGASGLAGKILLAEVCLGILVILMVFLLSRSIARPMRELAHYVGEASRGDLTIEIPLVKRNDEIGTLAKSFQGMLEGMRLQTRQVVQGVRTLSTAASEITSAVGELVKNASTTSSAVTETSSTVEQVKQAAKISSDKAKTVSETSQQAVKISESGRKATEETVHRMSVIKEQMESIGETVVRLSEQSQAIENIITSVQDLADQSNLLAVNASIEAARAGEQGKGFAVVAHEIKSLADQSKQATEQVRTILEDTRKWVSAVVMATEQGAKAVDAGLQQSVLAGESIVTLTDSVSVSAQAASVIDASSVQQVAGVGHVSSAMSSINEAMRQNLDRTSQLEDAVRQIRVLGESLKELVEKFRI